MLQDILTTALQVIAVGGTIAFATAFVTGYDSWKSARASVAAPIEEIAQEIDRTPEPAPIAYAHKSTLPDVLPTATPTIEVDLPIEILLNGYGYAHKSIAPVAELIIPVETESTPDLASMGRDELRSLCQERGIRWSRATACGNGKRHLNVSEMRAALSAG